MITIHPSRNSENTLAFKNCLFLCQGLYINEITVCTSSMEHSASLVTKFSLACQWKRANRQGIQHFCRRETLVRYRHPWKIHLKIKLLPEQERNIWSTTENLKKKNVDHGFLAGHRLYKPGHSSLQTFL